MKAPLLDTSALRLSHEGRVACKNLTTCNLGSADAPVADGFGAMVRTAVTCRYDLDQTMAVDIDITANN
jgi:hypothetical protein